MRALATDGRARATGGKAATTGCPGCCDTGCQCGCCAIEGNLCTFKPREPECKVIDSLVRFTGSGVMSWRWIKLNGKCQGYELNEWTVSGSVTGEVADTHDIGIKCNECAGCAEVFLPTPLQEGFFYLWGASSRFCWGGPFPLDINYPNPEPFLFTNVPVEGVDLPGQWARVQGEFRFIGLEYSSPPRVQVTAWHHINTGQTWWILKVVQCEGNGEAFGSGSLADFQIIRNKGGCPVGFKTRWIASTTSMDGNGDPIGTTESDLVLIADWLKGPLGCKDDGPILDTDSPDGPIDGTPLGGVARGFVLVPWAGTTWRGTPMPVRLWAWLAGKRYDRRGCGCNNKAKSLWERLTGRAA